MSYNLIDQPWITVRHHGGTPEDMSIMDTFRRAHEVQGLGGEVPTQSFAITRLLLAIVHGAVEGPRDLDQWKDLWGKETLPVKAIERYLNKRRTRFDLFDPVTPFFQVADLRTAKGEVSELNKLIADVPNGHPYFTTRLGPIDSLDIPEAARWLVHCQAFDPSGIKSGAVGDTRVKGGKGYPIGVGWSGLLGGVLAEGATLRETLLLNLIAYDGGNRSRWAEDGAAWERDHLGPGESPRTPAGPRDLYTWQSRRIRLVRDGDHVTGVLICNGDRLTPQNMHDLEPHTAWRRSKPQEKKLGMPLVYMPRGHDPDRAIWRGLQSMLPGAEKPQDGNAAAAVSPLMLEWIARLTLTAIDPDHRIRLRTVGMTYGSQSATTDDIIDDALDIHTLLLGADSAGLVDAAVQCVQAAELAARAVGNLAGNIATAAGRREVDGPTSRATELAYARLDDLFRTWISTLGAGDDPTERKAEWHHTAYNAVRELGDQLIDQASPTAWIGRVAGGRKVSTSHADAWFRGTLRRCLPLAFPPAPE
ncbi:type I-E CRISPR-associated protein Cse1/CasA [Kutzneria sp. NPDC052558]|uniref:type I-E CRISPR-associated protein Cse1/CasA n=1 Tax=Kutzneria sp. NPDC052558 TaxID=3364121 RepID=UPI0037CA480A